MNQSIEQRFTIIHKPFAELSPTELYAIMHLRNQVFVVEQNCVFQDADNKDQLAYHAMVWNKNELVAYSRLLPPGVTFAEKSIGRIASSPAYRGIGAGKLIVKTALELCTKLFGDGPTRIGAQRYLEKFYGNFGFVKTGGIYLEDGIEHVEMIKE
jgi:ElaA protein